MTDMYILGISGGHTTPRDVVRGGGHDPSACLLKDGRLIAFAEEERFIKVKHAPGYCPNNAVKYCLDEAKINLEDVDYVSFHIWHQKADLKVAMVRTVMSKIGSFLKVPQKTLAIKSFLPRHHVSHCASAFLVSGFKSASILSVDAVGDHKQTAILAEGEGNTLSFLKDYTMPHSLGYFYGLMTEYLGFRFANGEGKVMGLAPYGQPIHDFSEIINCDNSAPPKLWVNKEIMPRGEYGWAGNQPKLESILGPARKRGEEITQRHMDIAATVQKKTEEVMYKLTKFLVEQTNKPKLAIAGGVGLNCCVNGFLLRSGLISEIFIQPSANDAGVSLGSALLCATTYGDRINWKMEHAYYGPEFSNNEIETELKDHKLSYEQHDDIASVAGELVSKGYIVAWFQGRMEMGPRALGNRSILADPRDPKMKDHINYRVKHREPFRPFAPSMLAERASEYLEDAHPSPFMILAFKVKKEKLGEIPAVIHVDGTTRPHTVEKSVNEKYWELINAFAEKTEVPVVLNTSFNVRGEPIVCTPKDAIGTFLKTGIDYLAIGDFLTGKANVD